MPEPFPAPYTVNALDLHLYGADTTVRRAFHVWQLRDRKLKQLAQVTELSSKCSAASRLEAGSAAWDQALHHCIQLPLVLYYFIFIKSAFFSEKTEVSPQKKISKGERQYSWSRFWRNGLSPRAQGKAGKQQDPTSPCFSLFNTDTSHHVLRTIASTSLLLCP